MKLKTPAFAAAIAMSATGLVQARDISNTVWRLEIDAKGGGGWVIGKYSPEPFMCRQDVIDGLNVTGWDPDRFRCVEVEINGGKETHHY
jgi:hypothetical protein